MLKTTSPYSLARKAFVKADWLSPDDPTSTLIGRRFCFEQDALLIIGDIDSAGVDGSGLPKPTVSNKKFNDHTIRCLIPFGPGEACLECVDEVGKVYLYKGTFTFC